MIELITKYSEIDFAMYDSAVVIVTSSPDHPVTLDEKRIIDDCFGKIGFDRRRIIRFGEDASILNHHLKMLSILTNGAKHITMDEGTKEMIQGIIHQAKILEELMKELESPLDEIQKRNLDDEMIHIDSALCTAQCLYSVVTRIDDALHHPEEYLET